jgi:hypothetical protein
MADSAAVIHNEQRDMAVGQMQGMSPQQHRCVGNTSINNEDGNDNVEFNQFRTEDPPGMFMVPNMSFFNHELALRDAKIDALERRLSALYDRFGELSEAWLRQRMVQQQHGTSLGSHMTDQHWSEFMCTLLNSHSSYSFSLDKDDKFYSNGMEEDKEEKEGKEECCNGDHIKRNLKQRSYKSRHAQNNDDDNQDSDRDDTWCECMSKTTKQNAHMPRYAQNTD